MVLSLKDPPISSSCDELIRLLESLRLTMERQVDARHSLLSELPPHRRQSAGNLLHYLVLRSRDLQPLQEQLTRLGLSSLGRAEPRVLTTIDCVLNQLHRMTGQAASSDSVEHYPAAESAPKAVLQENTKQLLGSLAGGRNTRIMVTMSSAAADDYLLVHELVKNGMDCLRVNCTHDDRDTWHRTIQHVRDAERATGRACRVLMDLGGPKLRIGPMELMPAVLKIRPKRNRYGEILRPARIWLCPDDQPCATEAADAYLALDPQWLERLMPGDRLRLVDARDSKRTWRIRECNHDGIWAESKKTTYLVNGTELNRVGNGKLKTTIRNLPLVENKLTVRTGDVVLISGRDRPGRPAILDDDGALLNPGSVTLSVEEVYRDARPGEQVCFDDGHIVGMIEKIEDKQLRVRVTHTRKPVEKLSRDKGVNFPDTHLGLPALGARDVEDLEFAAEHADMVGLSFASCREDVRSLRERLLELGREDVGVVLKIETRRGFANLPDMLLEAMKFPAFGVMIARGDLGVECGLERMVELQQEIMWLCEAAHVPVIWATQVLENLAKQGHATRAEVTDAGMAQAAECVMLNKGPHIVDAVVMLDDILRRMQSHQDKKRSLLKALRVATDFTSGSSHKS